MVTLSGGAGRAYVGHQEAMVLGAWHIAYNDVVDLGNRRYGLGSATIDHANEFWALMPITHLVLRSGTQAWTWREVEVKLGMLLEFNVTGDPEISEWRE